jgi:outer membrane cobalamin receptor
MEDAQTGEKLIGANIYDANGYSGVSCNNYGFYSLSVTQGLHEIHWSYVGYQIEKRLLNLTKDTIINIRLKPSIELKEVEIKDKRADINVMNSKLGSIQIPINTIKNLPSLTGEIDILKILQLLPGVKSGNEGSTGIYVRGGSPDQNLIILDGVPVYNVSHLFGYLSIFNSNAIQNVELIKGGFPARYGGRLSSVIDIQSKDGNNKKFSGNVVFGYVCPQITLEGPVLSEKTSFLFSARRTYVDLIMRPITRSNNQSHGVDGSTGYFFYDINAKINHRFNNNNRLFFSIYNGIDEFDMDEDRDWEDMMSGYKSHDYNRSNMNWGNTTASLRWNHLFSNRLFMNLTTTYTKYHFNTLSEQLNETFINQVLTERQRYKLEYNSGIRDLGLRADFDYSLNANHQIKSGISVTNHNFNPGVKSLSGSVITADTTMNVGGDQIATYEVDYYAEDEIKINSRLRLNAGLHASNLVVESKIYASLQPRFQLNYKLKENWALKASFSTMTQYMHLLSNTTFGLPMDLWVPATAKIKPQQSWQAAMGISHSLRNNYELTIETYYKRMSDLIEYKEGASFFQEFSNWDEKVAVNGKGDSYGIEVLLQKKEGKTTGWIGYTLSWSNRQFDELNFGKTYPYRFDKRHDLSIVVSHKLKKSIELSGVWVFSTGTAMTIPIAFYQQSTDNAWWGGYTITEYSERNAVRMPVYHRLDLGINFIKERKKYTRIWNLSIYNTYGRKNPFFIYYSNQDKEGSGFKQLSVLMFIPSISYQIKF